MIGAWSGASTPLSNRRRKNGELCFDFAQQPKNGEGKPENEKRRWCDGETQRSDTREQKWETGELWLKYGMSNMEIERAYLDHETGTTP